jgi:hypothetical protein
MRKSTRSAAAIFTVGLAVAGCGASASPTINPPDRVQPGRGGAPSKIVLTPTGAQRIGVRTAPARAVGSSVVIPLSSVVYDPSGATYAFTTAAPLTFTEVPVTVEHVVGNSVHLLKGPAPGTEVVTSGAEELYGVQTGVLAQT